MDLLSHGQGLPPGTAMEQVRVGGGGMGGVRGGGSKYGPSRPIDLKDSTLN